jgi:hypothetical protein
MKKKKEAHFQYSFPISQGVLVRDQSWYIPERMLTDIGPYTGNALFTGNIHGPNATGHRLPPPFPCSVCSSIL